MSVVIIKTDDDDDDDDYKLSIKHTQSYTYAQAAKTAQCVPHRSLGSARWRIGLKMNGSM